MQNDAAAMSGCAINSPAASDRSEYVHNDSTLIDRLCRWSHERPDARAFTFLRGNGSERETLTFSELWQYSTTLAEMLLNLMEPGSRAVLAYNPGLAFVQAFFACQMSGIIAVPASMPHHGQAADRLGAIANHAAAHALLTGSDSLALLRDAFNGAFRSLDLQFIATDPVRAENRRDLPRVLSSNISMIQYTSGSTGTPRGAVLTHRNLMHNEALIEAAFDHDSETVFVSGLPVFHDMGLIGNILQPVYLGVHGVLISPMALLKRPACWLQAISQYRATTSGGPNFIFDLCVERIHKEELEEVDLSSWTIAFNGAEPINASSLERFEERFRPYGFKHTAFYPCYGLAEATLFVSGGPPNRPAVVRDVDREALRIGRVETPKTAAIRLVSSGRPAENDSVRIVDQNTLTPLQHNAIGEIWIQSESVASGYWNDTLGTSETFGACLRDNVARRFLRTGDLGFIDADGALFVTGRSKDLIIVRGQNFYPQDLEEAACAADFRLGRAGAFEATTEPHQIVLLAEARRAARRELADPDEARRLFAVIRKSLYRRHGIAIGTVAIVAPGSLPKTTSGKLRRKAAADAWASGNFEILASEQAAALIGENHEGRLEAILSSALGIREDRLEHALPLVAQGVDSLRAASLAAELGRHGIACPIAVLLTAESLEELKCSSSLHRIDVAVPGDVDGSRF
jgi:acyl-CoA synthetase (AMP-forming)/AMP-acid ligase II